MAKFLDESGLQHLMTKIKETFIGTGEVLVVDEFSTTVANKERYEQLKAALYWDREYIKPIFVREGDYITPAIAAKLTTNESLVVTYFDPTDPTHNRYKELVISSDGLLVSNTTYNMSEELGTATGDNLSMVYDSTERKIYATVGGVKVGEGIDASDFIKDGMLDDVEVITVGEDNLSEIQAVVSDAAVGDKVIKFTWNTDGSSKTDYIKTTDIAVDPETSTTQVSDDIIIAGGPLAELAASVFSNYQDEDGNTVIPKDMSMQELLTLLFCKVMWPTSIVTTGASLVSTVADPTITMGTSTVEVGTEVGYSVKNGKSGYTATPAKASGFTYGYSAADDDSKDSSATYVEGTVDNITAETTETTLTVTSTGNDSQTQAGGLDAGSAVIEGTIVAQEGTNTVTGQGTSGTYSGEASSLAVYYGCSNTGKTNNNGVNYPSEAKEAAALTSSVVTSTKATKSFTGVYKYFMGYSDNTSYDQFDSASVRALTVKTGNITKDGTTTVVGTTAVASDGRSIVIAVPSKYKLSAITNGLGADIKSNFSSVGTVSVKTGGGNGEAVDYTVYVYPITNGAVVEYKGVTIAKA